MMVIDKYAYSNRLVNWNPRTKALMWLLIMVFAFQPVIWIKCVLVVAVAAYTMYVTKVGFSRYLKWFYALLPFLLLSIIGIVFTMSANKASIYFPIHMFGNYFGVSKVMLPEGLKLGIRVLAAVVGTYWFALTTPLQQIIELMADLHLPKILIEETMLMYRFIFIFIDSFEQIYRAQKLRFGYQNFRVSFKSAGILGKMLFEQIIVNYQSMVRALDAKLYNGDFDVRKSDRK